jgi:cytochrome c
MIARTLLVAATALVWSCGAQADTVDQLMLKGGCVACHAKDKKTVGPAQKDIAAKYKGQDVVAKLMERVRKGGSGVYGTLAMTPTGPDKISDADLKTVIEAILKM